MLIYPQERAVLAERTQEAIDIGDHVIRALCAFSGLASAGIAALVGTEPEHRPVGALDATRDGDTALGVVVLEESR